VTGVSIRDLCAHFARRPGDLASVARATWRLRRRGWWHQSPFLPVPGRAYWRFRVVTATGSSMVTMSARDVIEYSRWSNLQMPKR